MVAVFEAHIISFECKLQLETEARNFPFSWSSLVYKIYSGQHINCIFPPLFLGGVGVLRIEC